LCLQVHTIGSYLEPEEFSLTLAANFKNHYNIVIPSIPTYPKWLYPSGFTNENVMNLLKICVCTESG